MNIRALRTTVLVAVLGVLSPQAFGQGTTVSPADLDKAAMANIHVGFYIGSLAMDRDSTNFRKMTKLQDGCKAKISADIEAAPAIASADEPKALLATKQLFLDCMAAGVAADPGLKVVRANVQTMAR